MIVSRDQTLHQFSDLVATRSRGERVYYVYAYNLLSNGGSFLGVLSKAFCALQSHLKFLQLFSGGGGSLYLLFGATG